jgi:hypothetical protein
MCDSKPEKPHSAEPHISEGQGHEKTNEPEHQATPPLQSPYPLERPQERSPHCCPETSIYDWRQKRHPNITDWIIACATVAMLFVAGVNAWVAHNQWQVMDRQANITDQQFHASHRPWVEAQISIENPLTFDDKGAQVGLNIKIKNGGTAPALGADPLFDIVIVGSDVRNMPDTGESYVVNRQSIFCSPQRVDALIKAGKLRGLVKLLLPNSEVTQPMVLLSGREQWQLAQPGEVFAVWLTGCVLYADEFGASIATSFTLDLMTSYPFKPKAGFTVKAGNWIPAPYGHNAY